MYFVVCVASKCFGNSASSSVTRSLTEGLGLAPSEASSASSQVKAVPDTKLASQRKTLLPSLSVRESMMETTGATWPLIARAEAAAASKSWQVMASLRLGSAFS
eukprot:CAMPEP_0195012040 /NCGR_PEP_ID=MMETSP0326_2-20130528/11482_1 /TAXON_ID=2866 ORGANISM="Crypthecodinium cohnii, Strain Seligo" /NCGR_SAMPLE_ID=MMETSP0326_2 /ASSEMBLY_ACC=CAM_ASM_000348 /LENGTH=103 /DNA_ID=CAMNT_0040021479 /DNA_START=245 /DNA_END=556 /DNA_ORIENTATION=-